MSLSFLVNGCRRINFEIIVLIECPYEECTRELHPRASRVVCQPEEGGTGEPSVLVEQVAKLVRNLHSSHAELVAVIISN